MELLRACAHGLGVAVLPTFAAAQLRELVRLSEVIEQPSTALWLLSHPDVRDNARVRAFSEFVATALPAELGARRAGEELRQTRDRSTRSSAPAAAGGVGRDCIAVWPAAAPRAQIPSSGRSVSWARSSSVFLSQRSQPRVCALATFSSFLRKMRSCAARAGFCEESASHSANSGLVMS